MEQNQTENPMKPLQETAPETAAAASDAVKKKHSLDWPDVRKWITLMACTFVFILGILLVFYYIWGPGYAEFHADCSDTLYWAEAAMQGKGLINPDFNYAAVMPLGGNLFMQLWYPFFGMSMTTHSLGMTTFFIVFTAALFWLLREMKWSLNWTLAGAGGLLTALLCSAKVREIFWGHIIYYSLGLLFLLIGLALVLHIYNLHEKEQTRSVRIQKGLFLALLLVMFLLSCTNSTTAIALFALPVAAALFCERFLDHTVPLTDKKNILGGIMLVICLIGILGGLKLGDWIAGGVQGLYANAHSDFTAESSWWEHVEKLPLEFLYLLGLEVDTDTALASLNGAKIILLLFYAALIVILPLAALLSYRKIEEKGLRMLIWAHFTSSAFILIGYICGMLSTANWRMSPILVTSFLVSLSYLRWLYAKADSRRLSVLLLIPFIWNSAQGVLNVFDMAPKAHLTSANYQLIAFLKEKGLDYGYATFWNSHSLTVQSNSECVVRAVHINAEGLQMNPYQGNAEWYEDQPGQEEYFLLMSAGERDALIASGSPVAEEEYTQYEYLDFIIWVFEENLF
ncbi:MAG: hypothetical protein IJ496_10225 [Ruminococcus sp.]|nr:hypothetical protein [Ruminococcus sp.]